MATIKDNSGETTAKATTAKASTAEKTVSKVPLHRVGVKRGGKTVYPAIGKPFDFTESEVEDLVKLGGTTKVDYIRDPVNEGGAAEAKKEENL